MKTIRGGSVGGREGRFRGKCEKKEGEEVKARRNDYESRRSRLRKRK